MHGLRSLFGLRVPGGSSLGVGPSRLVAVIGVAVLLLLAVPAAAVAVPATNPAPVADKIMCMCGCNSVLSNCPHAECGWGIPEKEFIGNELAAGKSADELIDYYVAQYGEEIMAAPSKSGFNLTAWVMPFALILTAAVAVFFLIQMWSRGRGEGEEATIVAPVLPEDKARRLDEELEDFD